MGVEWTAQAKQFIKNREYRYISPVFGYNKQTGEITVLQHAALVNHPAIDGMRDVSELIAARHQLYSPIQLTEDEQTACALMGLAEAEYLKTKIQSQNAHYVPHLMAAKTYHGLTDIELSVCEKMGINAKEFMATKVKNTAQ